MLWFRTRTIDSKWNKPWYKAVGASSHTHDIVGFFFSVRTKKEPGKTPSFFKVAC